jgi:hypothetical protein
MDPIMKLKTNWNLTKGPRIIFFKKGLKLKYH